MPVLGPIKRNDLVCYLKMLGFEGPYSGGKHQFMVKAELRLTLPNPHKGDISQALLLKILRQADISKDTWEQLR
ncbi:type II toxin-antitoxin system HicA family toxin [Nodosilinea sp. PGN35]|uniref:type II toxin-antitoxin system HicA family toxin n=1 Tax=Nodosilinea sp. PGN35 TaxID=3020489 RepID=UPI0023B33611|nr:type II toxin-antitoxin system HicA family toxin [Nodosilinea sp. TSF1-S3]